jgi:RNA polymerase sigma-70 factor (ECF subfamily)
MREERVLLGKAKQGNQFCFEELESVCRLKVLSSIRAWTKNDWCSAEDIYQRGITKAWKKIKGFKGESRFSTWLHRICYNLCCDDFRRTARRGESSLESLIERNVSITMSVNAACDYSLLNETNNLGVRNMEMKELGGRLDRTFEALDDGHKEILELFMVEGLSYAQIAKKIKCPIGTVMSRIFYARKKAQKAYERLLNAEIASERVL